MRAAGFFTRQTAREARRTKRRGRNQDGNLEDLRKLGVEGAAAMNPAAKSPAMLPRGKWPADIYVLGTAPTAGDDERGKPFTGESGELLRDELVEAAVVYDNICRTLPAKGRTPSVGEIECFRTAVEATIVEAKPKVIIGLGLAPMRWALEPDLNSIKALRGKYFPVTIGGHTCWFMPTLPPDMLLRIADRREDKVPGSEWRRFWRKDLAGAIARAGSDLVPVVEPRADALAGVVHCMTIAAVEKAVKALMRCKAIGVDIETHLHRPYRKGAMLLTIAFSDGDTTYGIPIDHPSSPWAPGNPNALQRPVLIDLLRKLLTGPKWVAHNAPYEHEWLLHYLGEGVHSARWGCSHQAAFALNPGPPSRDGDAGGGAAGHRLEDLTLEEFGLPIKSMTPGAKWVARLREKPLPEVLDYNALDAKWCLRVWWRLMAKCRAQGLMESYERQMRRIAPIVHAQAQGIPVDQKVRAEMEDGLRKQITEVTKAIRTDRAVRAWEKKRGNTFNPASPAHIGNLLRYHCGIKEVMVGGKITTKKSILEAIQGRAEVVPHLLRLRGLDKLLGVYVLRFDPNHPDSYIHADGLVHTAFPITKTRTARLSAEEPNCFPGHVEVLTGSGWKRWDEVTKKDRLAQYHDDGHIDFDKPLRMIRMPFKGNLVEIATGQQIRMVCTGNHRFMLRHRKSGKWSTFNADQYPSDWLQPQAGFYSGGHRSVPQHILVLCAAMQADGHIRKDGYGVEFQFSKKRKIDRLAAALVAAGLEHTRKKRKCDGKTRFRVIHPPKWLLDAKFFDKSLLSLDANSFAFMAEEVWFWDGCASRRSMYASAQKENADWVQVLTVLSGRRAKIRAHQPPNPRAQTSWQIDATDRDYSMTTGRTLTPVPFDGTVYCAEMPAGTLVVRHEGRVLITKNSQNWPKRKNRQIRRQLAAPKGWSWVAVDQGQIEARVLAMESCDPTWMRMIRENYDVHAEWAEKVAKIDDGFRAVWDANPKEARSIAKNQWVFPAFYGSSINSIINNLKLTSKTKANKLFAEFWDVFKGVKKWQQRQSKKYEMDGYVVSLTGRRRLGPLSYNMVINSPIQTTASDICVDAMERLFWRSMKENKPWLAARMQIHDDLSFLVPDEHLGEAVTDIVREQLAFKAPWVNVPLSVEAEMGPDLFAMDKIGAWTSDDLA